MRFCHFGNKKQVPCHLHGTFFNLPSWLIIQKHTNVTLLDYCLASLILFLYSVSLSNLARWKVKKKGLLRHMKDLVHCLSVSLSIISKFNQAIYVIIVSASTQDSTEKCYLRLSRHYDWTLKPFVSRLFPGSTI